MRHAWLVLFAACGLYEQQPPPICNETGAKPIASQLLRDPDTGQCVALGGQCGCGLCPATAPGSPSADWATCAGPCSNLDENACLASATCHAAYSDDPTPQPVYRACFDLPPTGAVFGDCTNLGAQICSEHPDCISIYTGPVNQGPSFVPSFESCKPKVSQPACATLATEAACKARADCDAVYTGSNCTCDKNGCTCQTETFSHCQ